MKKLKIVLAVGFFMLTACHKVHHNQTEVVVYTKAPLNAVLLIRNVSLLGEKEQIIDSGIVADNHDSVKLFVPADEDKIYRLTVKDNSRLQVAFANDAKTVRIHIDCFANKYTVSGSPATTSLRAFNESQAKLAEHGFRPAYYALDSLKKLGIIVGKQRDALVAKYNSELALFFKRYIGYADTVKNPAAFLVVYKAIDFGDDYKTFGAFVTRNAARFPGYGPVKQAKKEAMDVIRVHEEDFNVGDVLPSVTLPDVNGKAFSTGTLKGQYYLIDFWASYCSQCGSFKAAEMKLYNSGETRVKLISVALDDDPTAWRSLIRRNKMDWTNLVDEKMWTGPAVNTLLFDSIPFNFLVGPNGRVIKMAIKPDSLQKVISELKLR